MSSSSPTPTVEELRDMLPQILGALTWARDEAIVKCVDVKLQRGSDNGEPWESYAKAFAGLSESIAGMMEDTQRLTWLETNGGFAHDAEDRGMSMACWGKNWYAVSLREAIDAARRALDSTASPVAQSLVSDSREDTP